MTPPDDAATLDALRAENARLREALARAAPAALAAIPPTPPTSPRPAEPSPRRSRGLAFAVAFGAGVLAMLVGLRLLPPDLVAGFLDGARGVPPAEAVAPPTPPSAPSPP